LLRGWGLVCAMTIRALLFFGLASFASLLRGGIVTQTLEFRLFDAAPAVALSFNPIDPRLGAVTAVRANVEVTRRMDVGFWKTGGADGVVTFNASMTGSNLFLEDQSLLFEPAIVSLMQNVPIVSFGSASTWVNAFRNDYLSNLEPLVPSGLKGSKDIAAARSFVLPLTFDGKLDLSYDAGFWNPEVTTTWTPFGTWKVDMVGKVTLTYEYGTIPEPAVTTALLGAAALGLAAFRRKARSKLRRLPVALDQGAHCAPPVLAVADRRERVSSTVESH